MKKLIKFGAALVCCIVVLEVLAHSASAKEVQAWYIKRNGNSLPGFPCNAEELDKLDTYYVDKDAHENSKKKLYLTFDAGYENGNIEKILNVLKDEGVPAAFFVLKNLVVKNTDLVIRMAEEGHLVCNHTSSHKDLTASSPADIENEIYGLEKIYTNKTGRIMSKFFRFPEGKYSLNALNSIKNLGYSTVFWSFAYEDWDSKKQPIAEYAINKILENTHDGAVILLHPTSATNAEILPSLISKWKSMGYQFCSLNELKNNNK